MGEEPGHGEGICGHPNWRCVRCGQCVRCARGPILGRSVLPKLAACAVGSLTCLMAVASDQGQALVRDVPVESWLANLVLLALGLGIAFIGVAALHGSLATPHRCPHCDNDVMVKVR